MTRILHSTAFQEQALIKARERGTRSVQDVANDLNMSVGTLRKWISKSNQKAASNTYSAQLPENLPAPSWAPTQRLQALLETHAMAPEQLSAWCREKGLFEHQLQSWRDAFCTASAGETRESKAARCVSCKSSTKGCSVSCAERRRRWQKRQPCWCCKKSSMPCGRARRNEHLCAARLFAGSD